MLRKISRVYFNGDIAVIITSNMIILGLIHLLIIGFYCMFECVMNHTESEFKCNGIMHISSLTTSC